MEIPNVVQPSSEPTKRRGPKKLKFPELAHLSAVEYRRHYQNVRRREKIEAAKAPPPPPESAPAPESSPPPPPKPEPKKRGRKPTKCLTQGEGCEERMREYKRQYYKDHPEIWEAHAKKQAEDPEKAAKMREYRRNYYHRNADKFRKKKSLAVDIPTNDS